MTINRDNKNDPLGLTNLKIAIGRLTALKRDHPDDGNRPSRWYYLVDQLEMAFQDSLSKYELLKDRYALLKRANATLSDELVWLRDQIDDLASNNISYE